MKCREGVNGGEEVYLITWVTTLLELLLELKIRWMLFVLSDAGPGWGSSEARRSDVQRCTLVFKKWFEHLSFHIPVAFTSALFCMSDDYKLKALENAHFLHQIIIITGDLAFCLRKYNFVHQSVSLTVSTTSLVLPTQAIKRWSNFQLWMKDREEVCYTSSFNLLPQGTNWGRLPTNSIFVHSLFFPLRGLGGSVPSRSWHSGSHLFGLRPSPVSVMEAAQYRCIPTYTHRHSTLTHRQQ